MGANYSIMANFTRVYGLTVTRAGVGSGSVSSSPAGISCGADCSESYNTGTTVTLTATATVDSIFMGWSGACAGAACTVTMTADKTAVATFAPNQPDLVETSVSDPPAAAAPGSAFSVTDSVLNQGGVSVASTTTRYYLSGKFAPGTVTVSFQAGAWKDTLGNAGTAGTASFKTFDQFPSQTTGTPDKVYSTRGGFLPEVDFSPLEFGMPPNSVPATDTAQLLGLVVAKRVLEEGSTTVTEIGPSVRSAMMRARSQAPPTVTMAPRSILATRSHG